MKYTEFVKYEDGDEKLIRTVDISEKDAAEMNADNTYGDGSLHYRKTTKQDIAKLGGVDIPDELTCQGKGWDEWTVKSLRAFAEGEGIELESTAKADIMNEIDEKLT